MTAGWLWWVIFVFLVLSALFLGSLLLWPIGRALRSRPSEVVGCILAVGVGGATYALAKTFGVGVTVVGRWDQAGNLLIEPWLYLTAGLGAFSGHVAIRQMRRFRFESFRLSLVGLTWALAVNIEILIPLFRGAGQESWAFLLGADFVISAGLLGLVYSLRGDAEPGPSLDDPGPTLPPPALNTEPGDRSKDPPPPIDPF